MIRYSLRISEVVWQWQWELFTVSGNRENGNNTKNMSSDVPSHTHTQIYVCMHVYHSWNIPWVYSESFKLLLPCFQRCKHYNSWNGQMLIVLIFEDDNVFGRTIFWCVGCWIFIFCFLVLFLFFKLWLGGHMWDSFMLEFPLFWQIEHIFIGYKNLLPVLSSFGQVSTLFYGYINILWCLLG